MVILELGAGFNTPGIIRWPMENILAVNKAVHLVRINLEYPQVPSYLNSQSTSIKERIGYSLCAIRNQIKNLA